MVWKVSHVMDQKMRFVMDVEARDEGFSALCRAYGISRPTGYKWLARYEAEGLPGLEERSRAPLSHPQAMGAPMEAMLIKARASHPSWGPRKLLDYLKSEQRLEKLKWPAASTVGEMLKRRGLVHARRPRRRATPSPNPLIEGKHANEVWCADFKGWFRTADGGRCEPLTISDHATRYLIRCHANEGTKLETARPVFEAAFREYGMPERIRTDNGTPFGSVGLLGLSRLAVWWIKLGIQPERIEPGHPEQNGRHERMHRTMGETLEGQTLARDLRAAQKQLEKFRREYNEQRPHEALKGQRPAEVYTSSPRQYPARTPEIEYPSTMHKRRVCKRGDIIWHNNHLFLSEVLESQWVGLEWIDDQTLRIWFGPVHLADYQTLTGRIDYADGRKGKRWSNTMRQGRLMGIQNV